MDLKTLTQLLTNDLDWIVMKALEKDRNRRYDAPGSLAEDVQRYLRDEAILARPPTAVYRVRKFASRHRAAVLAAGAVTVTLVVGIAGATWQAVRQTSPEARARAAGAALGEVPARRRCSQGTCRGGQRLPADRPARPGQYRQPALDRQ